MFEYGTFGWGILMCVVVCAVFLIATFILCWIQEFFKKREALDWYIKERKKMRDGAPLDRPILMCPKSTEGRACTYEQCRAYKQCFKK